MLVAALLAAAFAAPLPPLAITGEATSIGTTSATLHGYVDPAGEPTRYYFDYGKDTLYGRRTPATDAASDPADVAASAQGLDADTLYHYRLVAVNASDTWEGQDRTFTTLKVSTRPPTPARAPRATATAPTDLTPYTATLHASVSPNGQATKVHFDYGTTAAFGSSTPDQDAGASLTASVPISAAISGLQPRTLYHVRAVATNALGVSYSRTRTFTTPLTPTAAALTAVPARPVWGTGVTVTAKISGQGLIPVALERQDFPFSAGFKEIASKKVDGMGRASFALPPLTATTRLRLVTRTPIPVTSPVRTVRVAVKVGLRVQRLAGGRARLSGTTWPAVPAGRASLQRKASTGRWVLVKRVKPAKLSGDRSRYAFTIVRRARAQSYRVVVVANDRGAHVPGTSRTALVPHR